MLKKLAALLCLSVIFAGCSGGAVVFAPTPAPVDQSPIRYDHPSSAFSLVLPRQWPVYEQNTTTLATAAFSVPGSEQPALLFAVINVGHPVDSTEFGSDIDLYQTTVRSDTGRYTEQSRQAMGDGSWRMTGLRSTPGGATEQVNTFLEQSGTFIGLIEIVMPSDPAQMEMLQSIVNSFTIKSDAALQASDLTTLAYAKDGALGVLHVTTWNTNSGVFFVTGEVANYGLTTLTGVPVQVDLRSADGLSVAGAVDAVMGYGIPPGGFAPFSLRFGQGQPSLATIYSVTLGGNDWQPDATEPVIYGQNEMTWTDESKFDNLNRLVISGTVTNISSHPINQPRATVTVFDGAQNVISAGFTNIQPDGADELKAGQTTTFEITLPEVGGNPENYIVNIEGVP
ncbi:MAG: FxLYD domain-containing protein [Chloroflexota bacterium]